MKRSKFKIQQLEENDWSFFQERIQNLEKGISYPIGDDWFKIDHGRNYFSFFSRLGKLHYQIVLHEKKVVAVAAAILREFIPVGGKKQRAVWYLCDLKVEPQFRGRYIPFKMFAHLAPKLHPICSSAYAISMDNQNEETNRMGLMLRRVPFVSIATSMPSV